MKALIEDIMIGATVTSTQRKSGIDADNFIDKRLSRYSAFIYSTNVTIDVTLAASDTFDSVCIAGHNLTTAASLTLQYSTTGFGSPDGSHVIAIDAPTIYESVSSTTAQYLRFIFTDSGATTGDTIKIGRMTAGNEYTFPGVGDTPQIDQKSNAVAELSITGQSYGSKISNYAQMSVEFPVITQTEKDSLIGDFYRIVDTFIQYFIRFDESCFLEGPFYVINTDMQTFGFNYTRGDFYTSRLNFRETF